MHVRQLLLPPLPMRRAHNDQDQARDTVPNVNNWTALQYIVELCKPDYLRFILQFEARRTPDKWLTTEVRSDAAPQF